LAIRNSLNQAASEAGRRAPKSCMDLSGVAQHAVERLAGYARITQELGQRPQPRQRELGPHGHGLETITAGKSETGRESPWSLPSRPCRIKG